MYPTFQWALIKGGRVDVSSHIKDGQANFSDATIGVKDDTDDVGGADAERFNRQVVVAAAGVEAVDPNRAQSFEKYFTLCKN